MFNTAFNDQIPAEKAAIDIYPQNLRTEIDSINEWVYDNVNSQSGSSPHIPTPFLINRVSWKMVSIGLGSPQPRKHTKKQSYKYSRPWINWKRFLPEKTILLVTN